MIQPPPPGEVEVLPIRGNVYAIFGAGGNIVVSVGSDGVLLVDAGRAGMTDKVLAAVQRLQREWPMRNEPKPIGFGAETRSSVADRHITGAAEADSLHHQHQRRSRSRRRQREAAQRGAHVHRRQRRRQHRRLRRGRGDSRARERAHEAGARAGEGQTPPPADALPTDTYFVDFYKLSHYFNGEGVQLFHMPKAHTDGDSIVHFRGTDVIALGDLMSTGSYPVIDVARGGTINGVIDGLNRVLDMSIAEFRLEGGTMMVPGHGRLVDSADVAYYRDMLTIIRDRVEDHGQEGQDARAGEGGEAERRLRHRIRLDDRAVDHRQVHRGGLQEPRRRRSRTAPCDPRGEPMTATTPVSGIGALLACVIVLAIAACADRGAARRPRPGSAAPSAQASAPLDLTGQWVSLVTDDWRWRMVTPPKGDVLYLPVNDAGRKVAEQWDPAKDEAAGEACKAYGAGGIMHWPGRLRITWENDNTLKLETDTGQQTRLFNFGSPQPPAGEPTWQGFSVGGVGTAGRRARPARRRRAAGGPATRPGRRCACHDPHAARATTAGTACRTARTRR